MRATNFWRWLAGLSLVLLMVGVPTLHYRQTYRYGKRLRPVTEGKLYRSGCLTADGLRDAIRRHKIKTVINLQDEDQDPALKNHYFAWGRTLESDVCRSAGARMIYFPVELTADFPATRPDTVATFLKIMDDPANYPVLLHCKAGLHRTGCLVAMYRQEYEGWSKADALHELKSHGFGEFFSTTANIYIVQYVLGYQPRRAQRKDRGETQFQGVSFSPLPRPPAPAPPAP